MNINEMDLDTLNKYLQNLNIDKSIYEKNIKELKNYINILKEEIDNQHLNLDDFKEIAENNKSIFSNTSSIISYLFVILVLLESFNPNLPIDVDTAFLISIICTFKMIYNYKKTDESIEETEKQYKEILQLKENQINDIYKQIKDNNNMLNGLCKEKEKVIIRVKKLNKK